MELKTFYSLNNNFNIHLKTAVCLKFYSCPGNILNLSTGPCGRGLNVDIHRWGDNMKTSLRRPIVLETSVEIYRYWVITKRVLCAQLTNLNSVLFFSVKSLLELNMSK